MGGTGVWLDGQFYFSIIKPLNWILHHRHLAPVNSRSLSLRARDQRHVHQMTNTYM